MELVILAAFSAILALLMAPWHKKAPKGAIKREGESPWR
jgi:hypothetical protein